jgi:hypothetical protein
VAVFVFFLCDCDSDGRLVGPWAACVPTEPLVLGGAMATFPFCLLHRLECLSTSSTDSTAMAESLTALAFQHVAP